MSEIFGICVKMGIPPDYILDRMENYELKAVINQYENDFKEKYERTRLVMHSIYQSQNTKQLKYSDIMSFDWDEDEVKEVKDPAERERLKQYALNLQNEMNGSNI